MFFLLVFGIYSLLNSVKNIFGVDCFRVLDTHMFDVSEESSMMSSMMSSKMIHIIIFMALAFFVYKKKYIPSDGIPIYLLRPCHNKNYNKKYNINVKRNKKIIYWVEGEDNNGGITNSDDEGNAEVKIIISNIRNHAKKVNYRIASPNMMSPVKHIYI